MKRTFSPYVVIPAEGRPIFCADRVDLMKVVINLISIGEIDFNFIEQY